LKQAGVRGARLSVEDDLVRIRFRNPEIDNERYAYLNWHLARATGRRVAYATSTGRQRRLNPRALLKSMLPEHCRIETLEHGSTGDAVWATVVGLLPEEMASISHEFQDASGVQLKVTGQMSLF
jgi:hypothetical protein